MMVDALRVKFGYDAPTSDSLKVLIYPHLNGVYSGDMTTNLLSMRGIGIFVTNEVRDEKTKEIIKPKMMFFCVKWANNNPDGLTQVYPKAFELESFEVNDYKRGYLIRQILNSTNFTYNIKVPDYDEATNRYASGSKISRNDLIGLALVHGHYKYDGIEYDYSEIADYKDSEIPKGDLIIRMNY